MELVLATYPVNLYYKKKNKTPLKGSILFPLSWK